MVQSAGAASPAMVDLVCAAFQPDRGGDASDPRRVLRAPRCGAERAGIRAIDLHGELARRVLGIERGANIVVAVDVDRDDRAGRGPVKVRTGAA